MSGFQDEFFKDLWTDVLLNESRSILCDYFREEKEQHIRVKLRRYCLEAGGLYGPPLLSFSALLELPELKKERKEMERQAGHPADDRLSCEERIRFVRQLLERLERDGKYAGEPDDSGQAAHSMKDGREKETKKNGNRPRRGQGEHACVEILCRYYDLRMAAQGGYGLCPEEKMDLNPHMADRDRCNPRSEEKMGCNPRMVDRAGVLVSEFLDELSRKADDAKAGSRRRARAREEIQRAGAQIGNGYKRIQREKERLSGALERAAARVIDLYLYAEAVQFLYNAGYPMPTGEDGEEYGREVRRPPQHGSSRIKTVPLKLLDFYFERRRITERYLTSISRMAPSRISESDTLKEKIEEVYEFACDNEMDRAVLPLLIDNDSGSGLYVLGSSYLHSWDKQAANYQKVQRILGGRPCCYAIVKFLNLELEDEGTYFWAPCSVADPLYGKCDVNPEGVLFTDLETALDIYQGQLSVSAHEVLYENFRSENIVYLRGTDIPVDPQFRKYFQVMEEEDGLEDERRSLMEEYGCHSSLPMSLS